MSAGNLIHLVLCDRGYFITPKAQILAHWDYFDGDFIGASPESVTGGINIFPTDFSEIQLNSIYPTDLDVEYSQLLVNL